jgi:hypothetical protein
MAGRNERAADISDFLEEEVNKQIRETALFVESELVRSAAVDTGLLRANFVATVGSPASGDVNIEDDNGLSTINTALSVIEAAKSVKYPTIYVQNNLPYSYRIMELGYSQQTPPKQLSLTIQKAVNK